MRRNALFPSAIRRVGGCSLDAGFVGLARRAPHTREPRPASSSVREQSQRWRRGRRRSALARGSSRRSRGVAGRKTNLLCSASARRFVGKVRSTQPCPMASRVKRTPRGSLKCPSSVRSIHRSASVDDENYRCKGHLTASYRRRHCCCKAAVLIPSVIDILANPKIRLDSVKRMTQIQNTS